MNEDEKKRFEEVLNYFQVKTNTDIIYLTDGGNSVICNPDTQFQDFLGYSINFIAETYAREVGKETKWL